MLGCERFVEANKLSGVGFVKHNSNAGYVETGNSRATPQAFSAHSFYASGGRVMVVDIQGVGDLYTDPQVHQYTHSTTPCHACVHIYRTLLSFMFVTLIHRFIPWTIDLVTLTWD